MNNNKNNNLFCLFQMYTPKLVLFGPNLIWGINIVSYVVREIIMHFQSGILEF